MRALLLTKLLLFIPFQLVVVGQAGAADTSAPMRGYVEIKKALAERVFSSPYFEPGTYIGEYSIYGSALLELLGTYKGASLDSQFHNGDPNSVNLILWQMLMNLLADDVGKLCEGSQKAQMRPEFVAAVKPLCTWPDSASHSSAALYGLWVALLSFDVPEAEFAAWQEFFLSPSYSADSPARAISDLTLAALMNPYFLLRN